jgi:hypothetical protein
MAKAGSHVFGINRHFNAIVSLECIVDGILIASPVSAQI